MEQTDPIAIFRKSDLKDAFREVLQEMTPNPEQVLSDKVNRDEACKILNCSFPTLNKHEKEGIVKRYGTPRKPYYFRNELIEVVRTMHTHTTKKIN
jgi:hypothetical protein